MIYAFDIVLTESCNLGTLRAVSIKLNFFLVSRF